MAKSTKAEPARAPVNSDNVQIWEELRTPDPMFTKEFNRGGFRGRMTSPTYIGRRMTEVFGPVGLGWGWKIDEIKYVPADRPEVVFVMVTVWYKNPYPASVGNRDDVVEIGSVTHIGGSQLVKFRKEKGSDKAVPAGYDDEAVKGAVTDAISKATSYLGMSADIHMGLFDDVKYLREAEGIFSKTDPIDPSRKAADRQNDLADAREERRAEPEKDPPKDPKPEKDPPKDPEAEERRKKEDWLDEVLDQIDKAPATEDGYKALFDIRDNRIKPAIEKWGKEDPVVEKVTKAFRERRRKLEDALGLD